jgi:RNA polymerase sigma factor (sigma-70 family)
MKSLTEQETLDDAQLVALCLSGRSEAFTQVVTRYQSLICGIAYSACGNVGGSEDLAQETFIAAWKNLAALNEPAKLKNWLCGIARNLIHNARRRERRTPTAEARPLPPEVCSEGASPHEHAMNREEEMLVWRALETIPPGYREPMVLFYREGRSTTAVAAALELSEDAVRQRLSRGRAMLNERVAKTVESALTRSAPGKVFTLGVLAALPAFAISADAATLGATAAKGSAAAKTAAATGLAGAILSPLLVFFGMWVGYRMSVDAAQCDHERDHVRGFSKRLMACLLGFFALYFVLMCGAKPLLASHPALFTGLAIGLALAYVAAIALLSLWSWRKQRSIRAVSSTKAQASNAAGPVWEYRSRFQLCGLPFVHLRVGGRTGVPVKAWIASGDCAVGVLFAFGGLAIAPVSVGGCALGLFAFGGLAIGALVLGGLGLGVWSCSGMALGWKAFGGCAVGWEAACGGVAIARDFALGGIAHAAQANNAAAEQHLGVSPFFRVSEVVLSHAVWINLIWVTPLLAWWQIAARRKRRATAIVLAALLVTIPFPTASAQSADQSATKPATSKTSSPERFDDLVRDDFFAGFQGDRASLDRAMKLCEDTLARNPQHAPAMVWHGSGLVYLSTLSFRSNDFTKGLDLWRRGLKEMDAAVALQPDHVDVLIARGATLLPVSRYDPNPDEARALLKIGLADFEKTLQLQNVYFESLSNHAKGELLSGLADGWLRLGDMDKSRTYLQRIAKDMAGTDYATRANDWLQTTDMEVLQKKSAAMSCIGCHAR